MHAHELEAVLARRDAAASRRRWVVFLCFVAIALAGAAIYYSEELQYTFGSEQRRREISQERHARTMLDIEKESRGK